MQANDSMGLFLECLIFKVKRLCLVEFGPTLLRTATSISQFITKPDCSLNKFREFLLLFSPALGAPGRAYPKILATPPRDFIL